MSFQLVPKSVTLNDLERVMAVTLRYFTEFGKPAAFQHITAWSCGGIYARVCCTAWPQNGTIFVRLDLIKY